MHFVYDNNWDLVHGLGLSHHYFSTGFSIAILVGAGYGLIRLSVDGSRLLTRVLRKLGLAARNVRLTPGRRRD